MNEISSIETIDRTNLTDLTKCRLNEISKIENCFNPEIKERKLNNKKSKYVAAFDYIDKILIVLFVASGGVSITSFTTVIGASVGIASGSFILICSLTTRIIKKLPSITRNRKKKHDKILVFAKSKLNSIETLVSQALIDMEISHEKIITILNEKDKYEKMKEDIRPIKSSDKLNKEGKNMKTTDL